MKIIEIVIFAYFAFYAVYNFMLTLGAKLHKARRIADAAPLHKIAVLIPGYKEDNVIIPVAKDALQNNYPPEMFDVIIIADSFRQDTLRELASLPLTLIEVEFEKSTKAKALNRAFAMLGDDYEIAVILDADNIMEKDFLQKINNAYHAGYHAIQAQRTAKNFTSPMAILDGISEAINNCTNRKGFNAFGLSSCLIGSGMAFNYQLVKRILGKIDAVGGFDRELQVIINEAGERILYLEDARVYDEKVENPHVFQNQRKRWLSSQFIYLKKHFLPGLKALLKLDINTFTITVLANFFLPRVMMLALIPFLAIIYFIFGRYLFLTPWHYIFIYVLVIASIFLAIPKSYYNKKLLQAVLQLPRTALLMAKSFLGMRGANKKFIHTPHTAVAMEDAAGEE